DLQPKLAARSSRWRVAPAESTGATLVCSRIESSPGIRVPDRCSLFVDRRVLPEETATSAFEEIMDIIRGLQAQDKDLVVEVEKLHVVEPAASDPDAALARALARNVQAVLGAEPKTELHTYYTEFRLFPHQWGAETVNYGPGRPERVAGEPEHVLVSDVVSA